MSVSFLGIPSRECEFLGLILTNPVCISEVVDRVPPAAFQNDLTRAIWVEMQGLARAGTRVSVQMLRERVRVEPSKFGIPDLTAFLATCMDQADGNLGIADLAEIMADGAILGELSQMLAEAQRMVLKGRTTGYELASNLRKQIDAMTNTTRSSETMLFSEAARKFAKSVADSFARGTPIGTDWGIRLLDNICGMITPGDMVVLGGPSGHGKSALAHQVAMHIARKGAPVLQIQAEMMHEAIAARDVLGETGINHAMIEAGGMQQAEVEAILSQAQRYDGIPYEICYTADMRLSRIRSRIEAFRHRHGGCGLVIIDTIKHVDPEDRGARSLVDRIIASIKSLQGMAGALNVPIMALAQVKEAYFERPTADIFLNDLYGGGDLREQADIILLAHQPVLKLSSISARSEREQDELDLLKTKWAGLAEVKCVKRRRGKGGTGRLRWDGPRTRFSELDG